MRINPFTGWVCLCLVAFPLSARAAKVAIAPVDYTQLGESAPAKDAAIQVEDKIAEGAREAGYEVLRGAVVADALGAIPECAQAQRSRVCLEKLAERLGVDEAISVSVSDDDHTSYRIELLHARRDKVVDERTAGFFVVLEWLRGTIALTLQKPAPQVENPGKPDESAPPDLSEKSDEPEKSDGSGAPGRKHLEPWLFWTGVGVTGALAIAWGATDIAAWKAPAGTDGERDHVEKLKVADGVLLGCALGAAVATTVIFFFTDFERPAPGVSPKGISTALAPIALPDGGGLVLEGRF